MSPRVRRSLFALEAITAIGALAAGLMMILDPGEGVSMGDDVLADLGYHSWRTPGLFLFGVIGVFPTVVIVAEAHRPGVPHGVDLVVAADHARGGDRRGRSRLDR